MVGGGIGGQLGGFDQYFAFKSSLYSENENLKRTLNENEASMANYNSILAENISLKEVLERKDAATSFILAAILSKPHQSPYDTLIIDVGGKQNLQKDSLVFAEGNVPIGRISEVYPDSSKVVLFSNSGEKTQVVTTSKPVQPDADRSSGQVFFEVMGRGGGNFEMIIPRDFKLTKGDEVALPGITPHVLGVVETIISDPRDPFVKALLVSPVNIQEIKFVQVKI